jgi:hypothetical protein
MHADAMHLVTTVSLAAWTIRYRCVAMSATTTVADVCTCGACVVFVLHRLLTA